MFFWLYLTKLKCFVKVRERSFLMDKYFKMSIGRKHCVTKPSPSQKVLIKVKLDPQLLLCKKCHTFCTGEPLPVNVIQATIRCPPKNTVFDKNMQQSIKKMFMVLRNYE